MLKFYLVLCIALTTVIIYCCNTHSKSDEFNTKCFVIKEALDTFRKIHEIELRFMKQNHFYICNFDHTIIDTSISMSEKPNFKTSENLLFTKEELLKLGRECLKIPNIKYLDAEQALDTLMANKTTDKIIYGITNFSKNDKYIYLIFGYHLSRRAIIADEYLFENKKGKYEIININQIAY